MCAMIKWFHFVFDATHKKPIHPKHEKIGKYGVEWKPPPLPPLLFQFCNTFSCRFFCLGNLSAHVMNGIRKRWKKRRKKTKDNIHLEKCGKGEEEEELSAYTQHAQKAFFEFRRKILISIILIHRRVIHKIHTPFFISKTRSRSTALLKIFRVCVLVN